MKKSALKEVIIVTGLLLLSIALILISCLINTDKSVDLVEYGKQYYSSRLPTLFSRNQRTVNGLLKSLFLSPNADETLPRSNWYDRSISQYVDGEFLGTLAASLFCKVNQDEVESNLEDKLGAYKDFLLGPYNKAFDQVAEQKIDSDANSIAPSKIKYLSRKFGLSNKKMTDFDVEKNISAFFQASFDFVDELGFEDFYGVLIAFLVASKKERNEFDSFDSAFKKYCKERNKTPYKLSGKYGATMVLRTTAAVICGPYRMSDCVETILRNLQQLSGKGNLPFYDSISSHTEFLEKVRNLDGVLYNVAVSKSRPKCFAISKMPETLGFSFDSSFVLEEEKSIITNDFIDFVCAEEELGFKESVKIIGKTNKIIEMDKEKFDLYEINPFLDNILVAIDEFMSLNLSTRGACTTPNFTENFQQKIFTALGFKVQKKKAVNNFKDEISSDFRFLEFSLNSRSFILKYRNYHAFIEEEVKK